MIVLRNLILVLGLIATVALAGAVLLWKSAEPQVVQLPPPPEAPASPPRAHIRVAMSAAFVSESGVGVYQKMAGYLTRKTGIQTEFISGLSYGTINSMIEEGILQSGFISGRSYTLLHDRAEPAARLIAAPVMKAPRYHGLPLYFADLIVRKDSPYQSLQDLKAKTYAYNDELSHTGYNIPRYRMLQLGLTQGFFAKVVRSGSHEESIRMVAAGEVDASFVDSLVLDFDREKGFGRAGEVRVIESISSSSISPFVASTQMPVELRDSLQHALVRMHEDPEGRRLLDEALVDRFAVVEDSNYNDTRVMTRAAEEAGFRSIR